MTLNKSTIFYKALTICMMALLPMQSLMAQIEEKDIEEAVEENDACFEPTDSIVEPTDEIMMPEAMTAELDSLLKEWHNSKYLTLAGDCDDAGNLEYDTATYIDRLSRLPNVMEMPYNDVVRKFIDQYTGRLRRSISLFLGSGNFYMPIFEEALDAYQLPLELKYLPVIESALNPMATSRAGAAGLWQFIITTGKLYGLEVTSLIDERRDPIKASYAAARYLKDLYAIFGDWTLVIASYNCGPNNVRKAISRAGGERDYWKIYPYLPAETRGYVPAFIAANYAMNYYREHNICPAECLLPAATDTVQIRQNLHYEQIAALCDVSTEELQALNPQYRTPLIPGDSHICTLRLPSAAMSRFVEWGDSVYRYRRDELITNRKVVEVAEVKGRRGRGGGRGTITVRRGDTLGAIARRYGTSVARLRKLNGLRNNDIQAGQKLKVG